MRKTLLVLLALVLVLSTACASGTRAPRPDGSVPHPAPRGTWLVTLSSAELGELRIPMRFRDHGGGDYEAHSRPGALSTMIGGGRALLARLFGGSAYDRGALLHIKNGTTWSGRDTVHIRGLFMAPIMGQSTLTARIEQDAISGDLHRISNGRLWATFHAIPHSGNAPVRDYEKVLNELRSVLTERLYDPRLLQSARWRTFLSTLDRRLPHVRDDAEALMQFFLAAQPLELSHFALLGTDFGEIELGTGDSAPTEVDPPVHLTFPEPGVALLTIRHFLGTPEPIQEAFTQIESAGADVLIVDVRGNPGGNFSSMAVAAHLLSEDTPAGVFVGASWWEQHSMLPQSNELDSLPALTSFDLEVFFRDLREHGALAGRVRPKAPHFAGRVYVLADARTASAAEPLVELLRATGRALIIGETTAGAMLSSERFPLEAGLVLLVPTGDYHTAEGRRLEGAGVAPDVAVPSAEALDASLSLAARTEPD